MVALGGGTEQELARLLSEHPQSNGAGTGHTLSQRVAERTLTSPPL